jgi:Cd(II)/Pb(II)-responsive transcriptional regulator
MKIGQLSELSGCSIQTIRYYEKEGLIDAPSRSEGNFRLYNQAALSRLQFIRRCRTLDITLAEIHQLLDLQQTPTESCQQVSTMVDKHITDVQHQIEELTALKSELRGLREKCHDDTVVDDCGIMENLTNPN